MKRGTRKRGTRKRGTRKPRSGMRLRKDKTMRSILSKRRCSNHISTLKVKSRKICPLAEDKIRKSQVKYSAGLNVPLMPRNPQWVLEI